MLRVSSPLTESEEKLVTAAMDCGFAVSRTLGQGFREKIYERAYCLELDSKGLPFECEKKIHRAQVLSYLKTTGLRVGLLIEFQYDRARGWFSSGGVLRVASCRRVVASS